MTVSAEFDRSGLTGVATGILTPFDDALEVDHNALAANARAIYDGGVRTFFACGNVSEYHSLSHDERIAVTETSIDALGSDATVLAGAGGSTKTAVALARAHETAGADAIMVMPPDHTYLHEDGLIAYHRRIAEAVDVPLVPYVRGYDPAVGLVARLTDLPSVAGLKWAVEDAAKFAECVAAGADDVVWLNGLGEPHAPALYAEGARGMAAGIGNFEPAVALALFDALEAGRTERARAIRDATVPYMNFRTESGTDTTFPAAYSIPAVKAGLEFAGLTGGPVREPLVDLPEAAYERARALYEDITAFIDEEL